MPEHLIRETKQQTATSISSHRSSSTSVDTAIAPPFSPQPSVGLPAVPAIPASLFLPSSPRPLYTPGLGKRHCSSSSHRRRQPRPPTVKFTRVERNGIGVEACYVCGGTAHASNPHLGPVAWSLVCPPGRTLYLHRRFDFRSVDVIWAVRFP
jgi:hypothetical protein